MVEKTGSEAVVREIKRRIRKKYSSEEKIRIVLQGLRGEENIAELCRKGGIQPNVRETLQNQVLSPPFRDPHHQFGCLEIAIPTGECYIKGDGEAAIRTLEKSAN
jgi:hypothetical protein